MTQFGLGMVIEVSPVSANAYSPIESTVDGIIMLSRFVQPLKVSPPIVFNLLLNSMFFRLGHLLNEPSICKTESGIFIETKLIILEKEPLPIFQTQLGILIVLNLLPSNALLSTLVTESGIS